MRTVLFFTLMLIAESIGKQTGWAMTHNEVNGALFVTFFAFISDIIYLVKIK